MTTSEYMIVAGPACLHLHDGVIHLLSEACPLNAPAERRQFTAADMRAQYSAGFRDGLAVHAPHDPKAPVIAGSG